MRISHRYRFVFFANPKTASSSVRRFLDPWSDVRPVPRFAEVTDDNPFHPHMRPEEARRFFERFGWDFEAYERFVCVRNPWARMVSLYRHLERDRKSPQVEPLLPFRDWLQRLPDLDPEDPRRWRVYGTWSTGRFVRGEAGEALVTRILRTEDLDRELVPFLRSLGVPIVGNAAVPRRNYTGEGSDYLRWYSKETAELVERLFDDDVAQFGYEFGDPA